MNTPTTIFLSITQVLAIHDQMIKRFGGSSGIRDIQLLKSAVARSQATFDKKELYKTVFDKAAALLQSLLENHPFVDGNKRTALTAAGLFLQLNGWKVQNQHKEEVTLAVDVDNEKLSVEEIAQWLRNHSKKISI